MMSTVTVGLSSDPSLTLNVNESTSAMANAAPGVYVTSASVSDVIVTGPSAPLVGSLGVLTPDTATSNTIIYTPMSSNAVGGTFRAPIGTIDMVAVASALLCLPSNTL